MCLRFEEKPLERPRYFYTAFGRGNLRPLLERFARILLWLNDDGLHLKM
jgi:hypothetical protein